MNINVAHVVASLDSRFGGTSRSVPQSINSLASVPGVGITLFTEAGANADILLPINPRVKNVITQKNDGVVGRLSTNLRRALYRDVNTDNFSLIHDHGVWLPSNHYASCLARDTRIPIIVQPHGMLEPWSLGHKAWKKKVALLTYQMKDLKNSDSFVATSEQECDSIRRLGLKQPIAIIPNGVTMEGFKFNRQVTDIGGKKIALFLSRIHPKKGIPDLLRAWASIQPMGWILRIVGPDEVGHRNECEALAAKLNIHSQVEFQGEVDGQFKGKLFEEASLFVLPTYSENFGIVVAEALSYALPVITTQGTPWKDLETCRCGWWVPTGPEALGEALGQAMGMSPQELVDMGLRGREYVARYTWSQNADLTAVFYEWLLYKGTLPSFVNIG